MALTLGARLGPYEILGALGAGGMGEVYRARDTRLDRTVAVKVLSASLAAEPGLRDRFDREARVISSLNHPHICSLFDVGHQDGVDFLVLEYLEGETVAERLAGHGRLDPEAALKIAIDICDALDKAHRSGVVHRDLKPANVFLVRSGGASAPPIAKLLDFGLAKSAAPVVATSELSMLPTTPANLTAQGTILGTFQYMAPEQIEGLEADARTDIFAFGALLFEMLTGRTAFEGKTRASLLGAILKDEAPPVSRLQSVAPPALDRIIGTCLAKDPDDRYQAARDLLRDLKWVSSGSSDGGGIRPIVPPGRSSRVAWLVAALSIVALIATSVIALRRVGGVAPSAGPVEFTIAPPENTSFGGPRGLGSGSASQVALSPDGRNIAFVAGAQSSYRIWLRPVATMAATPVPGTEGGTFPFWSPDSRFIGFFAAGKLKRVEIAGGPAIPLCDAAFGRGGTWSRDNVILFTPSTNVGLQRVSSAGGVPTAVTTLDPATGESSHRWPFFLPDGHHFLYTASTGTCCPAAKPSTIRIGSLDQPDTATLFHGVESSVSYASGHVLFATIDETLMAQPFDPDTRQLKGDAFPLAEHVSTEGTRYVGASVSESGTLVYAHGFSQAATQLTWFDRLGHALGTLDDAAPFTSLALSPDERRVAVGKVTRSPANVDIWIIDLARYAPSRQTIDPGTDQWPVWSPDGTRIVFASQRLGKISLRQKLIDGTGTDELLFEGPGAVAPTGWSADGRFITYTDRTSGNNDIWALPLFGDRKPFPLVQTGFQEAAAVFAPDGRSIAYVSNETSQYNVFVQPFPGPGGKAQISKDGGSQPVWGADGKELFYLAADGTLMAVAIDATGQIPAGVPQALFLTTAPIFNNLQNQYAAAKDGKRFLINAIPQQSNVAPLTVVLNWTATIRK